MTATATVLASAMLAALSLEYKHAKDCLGWREELGLIMESGDASRVKGFFDKFYNGDDDIYANPRVPLPIKTADGWDWEVKGPRLSVVGNSWTIKSDGQELHDAPNWLHALLATKYAKSTTQYAKSTAHVMVSGVRLEVVIHRQSGDCLRAIWQGYSDIGNKTLNVWPIPGFAETGLPRNPFIIYQNLCVPSMWFHMVALRRVTEAMAPEILRYFDLPQQVEADPDLISDDCWS